MRSSRLHFDEADSTIKTIAGDLRWLAEVGRGDKQHSAIIKAMRGANELADLLPAKRSTHFVASATN